MNRSMCVGYCETFGAMSNTCWAACGGCPTEAHGVQELDVPSPSSHALVGLHCCASKLLLCCVPLLSGGGPCAPAGTRRHDLVVVASLIDKVPNLAGLARTAEVLGAGTLVLSDLRVANDQLFTR